MLVTHATPWTPPWVSPAKRLLQFLHAAARLCICALFPSRGPTVALRCLRAFLLQHPCSIGPLRPRVCAPARREACMWLHCGNSSPSRGPNVALQCLHAFPRQSLCICVPLRPAPVPVYGVKPAAPGISGTAGEKKAHHLHARTRFSLVSGLWAKYPWRL